MIPTNLILSSQSGLPTNLTGTSVETGGALQLSDFKEINFAKFFLTQFQQAQTKQIQTLQPEQPLPVSGSELPLLPALVAVEQPVETLQTDPEQTVVLPLINPVQLPQLQQAKDKVASEPELTEELPPILKKVVLQGTPEHKEVQLFSKESLATNTGGKLVSENITDQKPNILPQLSLEKADIGKLIDKPLPQVDKAPLQSISSIEPLHTRPLIPVTGEVQSKPVKLTLDAPFAQAKWSESLAGRVVWMAAENHSTAKITLNPPELGPIEVRVSVNNDQTNVNFVAQHSAVRDAIEDAFPRLRDMFNQNGINLGEANVSDQSLTNKGRDQGEVVSEQTANYGDEVEAAELEQDTRVARGSGLVDHFV